MPISLTCTCGAQQWVAETLAGGAVVCPACGRAMSVPAMGRLVAAKAKPAAAARRQPWRYTPVLLIGSMAAAVLGAASFLGWAIIERKEREHPAPLVERKDADGPEAKHVEPSANPKPAGREEKQTQPIADPAPAPQKEPMKIALAPVRPRDESPPPIIVPARPKDPAPTPIVPEKKPNNLIEPLKLVWKLNAQDVLFQELIVTQRPTYVVQGLPVTAFLQYRVVSRFSVKERKDDGSLVVEQKIEAAKLLQADDFTRPTVAGSVAKMPGTRYTLHFNPKMEITKFEGGAGEGQLMQIAAGLGMQMATLLDRDGWKELDQATFFQMNGELKPDARWSKPLEHNWGPLGSWKGQTLYQYLGEEKGLQKISYGLQLAYQAPKGGGAGLMPVNAANFQQPNAGGMLLFDAGRGRVVAAEERFRVKGLININLLGQNTPVGIDEDQHFLIRIHDKLEDAAK